MKQDNHLSKVYLFLVCAMFIGMVAISIAPLRMIKNYQSKIVEESSVELVDNVVAESQRLMEKLVSQTIIQKANDMAKQMRLLIANNHGFLDVNGEAFKEIAIQKVGKGGYTCVYDCKTAVMLAHPNQALVGRDMHFLKEKLPDWWKIFGPSLNCVESDGFYNWEDPDGIIRRKYMSMIPVENSNLMVAATIYLDEFNETKEIIQNSGAENLFRTKATLTTLANKLILQTVIISILFISIIVVFMGYIWRKFLRSLNRLIIGINNCSKGFLEKLTLNECPGMAGILNNYNKVVDSLVGANKIKVRALIGDLATQLSHDIRSPLAALNVAISDLKEVPEERRILIRSAVQRIEDIANDLASRKEGVPSTSLGAGRGEGLGVSEEKISDTDEKKKTHHLVSAVQAIVSEKRTEHQQRKNITLETRFEENAYQLFAKIQPSEFKRILSNIVNNSYEAIVGSGSGEIHLSVVEKESSILVIVHDTGCGISQDKLPHLMQRGASFGKEGGQGLGLFHAKETIESWGGAIAIESQEGVGTTVTLSLPKQPTPDWFAAEVVVARDQHVVILDDDESIHLVWKGRLRKQGIDEDCVCHFTTPEQLIDWFRRPETRNLKPETFLFLCDYELIGSIKTGLDVIKELHPVESAQGAAPLCGDSTGVNIANQCVLVTSHYEEKEIRDECKRLGIKLLPKGLAGFVPISVVSKCLSVEVPKLGRVDCDVILIDDEEMIHSTWELMARMKKKKIAHFNHPHEFLKDINNYSPQTPIYIDSDLGNGVKGEIIAQEIFNKGFKEIYLCTGSEPKEYPQMTWIKEVVSKTPRFV